MDSNVFCRNQSFEKFLLLFRDASFDACHCFIKDISNAMQKFPKVLYPSLSIKYLHAIFSGTHSF